VIGVRVHVWDVIVFPPTHTFHGEHLVTDPSRSLSPAIRSVENDLSSRREWLRRASALLVAAVAAPIAFRDVAAQGGQTGQIPRALTVYKSPTCDCCKAWVAHVQRAGFTVTARDLADLSEVKAAFGIPRALESCHTAQIGGYLVEGHVPADLIEKMLREKPVGRGLAVPGMPVGSPGMEGGTPERYQVMLFDKSGSARVYATR
jgi:hypothetical protein